MHIKYAYDTINARKGSYADCVTDTGTVIASAGTGVDGDFSTVYDYVYLSQGRTRSFRNEDESLYSYSFLENLVSHRTVESPAGTFYTRSLSSNRFESTIDSAQFCPVGTSTKGSLVDIASASEQNGNKVTYSFSNQLTGSSSGVCTPYTWNEETGQSKDVTNNINLTEQVEAFSTLGVFETQGTVDESYYCSGWDLTCSEIINQNEIFYTTTGEQSVYGWQYTITGSEDPERSNTKTVTSLTQKLDEDEVWVNLIQDLSSGTHKIGEAFTTTSLPNDQIIQNFIYGETGTPLDEDCKTSFDVTVEMQQVPPQITGQYTVEALGNFEVHFKDLTNRGYLGFGLPEAYSDVTGKETYEVFELQAQGNYFNESDTLNTFDFERSQIDNKAYLLTTDNKSFVKKGATYRWVYDTGENCEILNDNTATSTKIKVTYSSLNGQETLYKYDTYTLRVLDPMEKEDLTFVYNENEAEKIFSRGSVLTAQNSFGAPNYFASLFQTRISPIIPNNEKEASTLSISNNGAYTLFHMEKQAGVTGEESFVLDTGGGITKDLVSNKYYTLKSEPIIKVDQAGDFYQHWHTQFMFSELDPDVYDDSYFSYSFDCDIAT